MHGSTPIMRRNNASGRLNGFGRLALLKEQQDTAGLYLEVRDGARGLAKSFVFRYTLAGRERWMGLGSAYTISLRDARAKAQGARKLLAEGVDPLQHKRQRAASQPDPGHTFAAVAERYFALNNGAWRSAIHRQQVVVV